MKDFGDYIVEKSKEYAEEVEYQLAYRQGAEEALNWVSANIEELLKAKQGGAN